MAGEGSEFDPLARLPGNALNPGLKRLRRDLDNGTWQDRHHDLLDRDAIDAGLRLTLALAER